MKTLFLVIGWLVVLSLSCRPAPDPQTAPLANGSDWKPQLDSLLPRLGHRNWLVVADGALPWQTAPGIVYLNTNQPMRVVLPYTLERLAQSRHVRPVLYQDRELTYLTAAEVPSIGAFRAERQRQLADRPVRTILHDSVFTRLDRASRLFRVVVLKTTETVPYSSVFMELDCAYWDSRRESQLRQRMAAPTTTARHSP